MYIPSSKFEGGWENSRQLGKPETQTKVYLSDFVAVKLRFYQA